MGIRWTVGSNVIFFFFNDTATTEIYTLSLHDALPILEPVLFAAQRQVVLDRVQGMHGVEMREDEHPRPVRARPGADRKSTRLNSSHANISYAVFCLKKKKNYIIQLTAHLKFHL